MSQLVTIRAGLHGAWIKGLSFTEFEGKGLNCKGRNWKGRFDCMELERVELDYMY